MSKPSLQEPAHFYHSNRLIGMGLLCLCLAMLCFGVGAFLDHPGSPWGIFFISLGILCGVGTNLSFILYAYEARKHRRT